MVMTLLPFHNSDPDPAPTLAPTMNTSLGPAGMSMATMASLFWSTILAAVTYWLPGPRILCTCACTRKGRSQWHDPCFRPSDNQTAQHPCWWASDTDQLHEGVVPGVIRNFAPAASGWAQHECAARNEDLSWLWQWPQTMSPTLSLSVLIPRLD